MPLRFDRTGVERVDERLDGRTLRTDEVVVDHALPLIFRGVLGRVEVRPREQPLPHRIGAPLGHATSSTDSSWPVRSRSSSTSVGSSFRTIWSPERRNWATDR